MPKRAAFSDSPGGAIASCRRKSGGRRESVPLTSARVARAGYSSTAGSATGLGRITFHHRCENPSEPPGAVAACLKGPRLPSLKTFQVIAGCSNGPGDERGGLPTMGAAGDYKSVKLKSWRPPGCRVYG